MLDEKHRHLPTRHVDTLGQDTGQRLSLARSVAVASDATVDDVDGVRVFDAAKSNSAFHVVRLMRGKGKARAHSGPC
jgi:hypothetical protein